MKKQGKAIKTFDNKWTIPTGQGYPKVLEGRKLLQEDFEYDEDDEYDIIEEKLNVNLNKYNYNTYIPKVKEFMTTFGQPVVDKPSIMSENRNKLRIALIFEELKEYAEASGMLDYFIRLCENSSQVFTKEQSNSTMYAPIIDLVEQFDALLDLQYVLSGTVIENGFGEIFDEGFDEVHISNMSKACNNNIESIETFEKYKNEGINIHFGLTYEDIENEKMYPCPVYRKEDNKVLKSINYSPANLQPIIDKCLNTKNHNQNDYNNPVNL